MSFSICDKLAIFSIDLDNITRLTKKKESESVVATTNHRLHTPLTAPLDITS